MARGVGAPLRLRAQARRLVEQGERRLGQDPEAKLPFLDSMRYQWKEIFISAGALASLFSLFYMGT